MFSGCPSATIAKGGGFTPSVPPPSPQIPFGAPTFVVTNATVTAGDRFLFVQWSGPLAEVNPPITGYIVRATSTAPNAITRENVTLSVQDTELFLSEIINGVEYLVTILSFNNVGIGQSSAPFQAPVPQIAPPGTPSFPLTESTFDETIQVSFRRPRSGGPVEFYTVSVQIRQFGFIYGRRELFRFTVSSPSLTSRPFGRIRANISPLVNGITYRIQIRAENAGGVSSWSRPSIFGTPLGTPSSPLNLIASAGDSIVNLTWSSPESNGGESIDAFLISSGTGGQFTTDTIANASDVSLGEAGTFFASISGLDSLIEYQFRVAAINGRGVGSPSQIVFATPTGSIPLPPEKVLAFGKDKAARLSWDQPTENGGLRIEKYEIDTFSGNLFAFQLTASLESLKITQNGRLSFTVANLQNDFSYSFAVRAVNAAGSSLPSKIVNAIPTNVRAPSRPIDVNAVPNEAFSIQVAWRPPVIDGGSDIIEYSIRLRYFDFAGRRQARFKRIRRSNPINGGGLLTAIIRRLEPGIRYEVSVRAKNSIGKSQWSFPASVEI